MYHPDDDGGDLQARMDAVKRCVTCGAVEGHRPWCPVEDDDDAIASVDDAEDEEPEDEADELFAR